MVKKRQDAISVRLMELAQPPTSANVRIACSAAIVLTLRRSEVLVGTGISIQTSPADAKGCLSKASPTSSPSMFQFYHKVGPKILHTFFRLTLHCLLLRSSEALLSNTLLLDAVLDTSVSESAGAFVSGSDCIVPVPLSAISSVPPVNTCIASFSSGRVKPLSFTRAQSIGHRAISDKEKTNTILIAA